MESNLTVREMTTEDIQHVVNYWDTASEEYMKGMGADINLLPPPAEFTKALHSQLATIKKERKGYVIIWLLDGQAVGHSHINKIKFGEEAFMHLHLWPAQKRKKGLGSTFVKHSIPFYFENFELENLYCEPYALNPAPHAVLKKLGFEFVKEYITKPGYINFEQPVKRWRLSKEAFGNL